MLSLDALFDEDAKAAHKAAVSGKWFEIRLAPDLVSGEILNIGVGFIRARTRSFHFRLLESSAPFGCLYGQAGRQQFGFLLSVVRESLTTHGPSPHISPQISFGEPRPASGASVEQILDDLYRSVVTLARRNHDTDASDTAEANGSSQSTERLRKSMRKALQARDKKGFLDYWRDAPVEVRVDDVMHPIDCQIWQGEDLVRSRTFASIVSACYRNEHYRRSYLTGAYHSLTIARSYSSMAKGALFILAPSPGGRMSDLVRSIDDEIDHTTWILNKKFNIHPEVETDMHTLKARVLEFVE